MKRGFETKKEAQDWERHFKLEKASSLDMTFGDFYRRYEEDVKPKVRENTWNSKVWVIEKKILPWQRLFMKNGRRGSMSAKNLDPKGRLRSKTIAYRCSPAERKELDKRWKLLGYATKQDYVLDSVLHNKVTAKGNPMMLVNFRKELYGILGELERLEEASEIDEELFTPIRTMLEILEAFKENEP